MSTVDLRSDTVTRPSPAMRQAMVDAEVGDDVYGEDPTVLALEQRVAALFGKEQGLFVPSGTMGNQIGLRLLVPPGDELICDADAHVVTYEHGAAAQYGGISTRTLLRPRGLLDPDELAGQLRPDGGYTVPTRAVAIEQTHNRGGGAVYPLPTLQRLRAVTSASGVRLHCDGARIWNAMVAAGVSGAAYGTLTDTLSVCLSKGLGAPVGSVLVGPADLMARARSLRKGLGGGMRQAGVLAAAGLYALDHQLDRLADDHARARRIAVALAELGACDVEATETNIVLVGTGARPAADVVAELGAAGVLANAVGPSSLRLVLHLDVDDDGVDRALVALHAALTAGRRAPG